MRKKDDLMDMRWALFGAALGFLVAGCLLSSTPEPRHKQEVSQYTPNKEDENNFPRESFWQRTTNDPTALFTFWLALFTAGLTISTVGLWAVTYLTLRHARQDAARQARDTEKSLDASVKAANAADLSARAAVGLQAAIIRMEPDDIGYLTTGDGCSVHIDTLKFFNIGGSKAFPIDIRYGFFFGDELPGDPEYTGVHVLKPNSVLEPHGPTSAMTEHTRQVSAQVPDDAYNQIRHDKKKLWFFCVLAYLDFINERREIGFCWHRIETIGGGKWIADPTQAYNRKT